MTQATLTTLMVFSCSVSSYRLTPWTRSDVKKSDDDNTTLKKKLKMYKYDNKMYIENLPAVAYRQLVEELNRDSCWNHLAEVISELLGYVGPSWIKSLEYEGMHQSNRSPPENLLDNLSNRMWTVEVLCHLLEECNLLRALSILQSPVPLSIIRHPNNESSDVEVALGEVLKLTCEATGLPPPSYTWYHENVAMEDQKQPDLSLEIRNLNQEGEYKCLVCQTDCDNVTLDYKFSDAAYLKIKSTSVVIKSQPQPFLEVKMDNILILTCQAESHPAPEYQWFRDNTRLDGQTSNILKIERFNLKNEGKYFCLISNQVSEIYSEKCTVIMDLPREKAVAKIALLIANDDYGHHKKLKTPRRDVSKLAELLEEIGFHVICLLNLSIDQMKNAMKIFCAILTDGVYGLFYFAGHGFKMQESYMLATDAPKNFLRSDAICESELLAMVLPKDPALLVVILDTCQTMPPKGSNPNIHQEVPTVNEYRSKKNLRNLIQAYSTSTHRPSYERSSTDCGLYVMHLSKYITQDIPVQKIFEETGKSIDIWFKGKERDQIPMFSLTITKPFRLTDATYAGDPPEAIKKFKYLTAFPTKTIDLIFKQSGIQCQLILSQLAKPYLNIVKLSLYGIDDLTSNVHNSVAIEKNNLFRSSQANEFRIHNPQISKGSLVVSIERDGNTIGATLFSIMDHVPFLLRKL